MNDDTTPGDDTAAATTATSSVGVPVRERYGIVLLLILGGYLIAGFGADGWAQIVGGVMWMLLLLAVLWAPGIPDRLRRAGAVVTILLLAATSVLAFVGGPTGHGVVLFLACMAQLLALLAILARISQHSRVSMQTVMGAIAAYTLLGFSMAALYHGLSLVTTTPFLEGAVADGDYVYFSFVTLTTVGYGDITAASELAKRLVVVEALAGQIFLITFVARLVSLWGQPLRRPPR